MEGESRPVLFILVFAALSTKPGTEKGLICFHRMDVGMKGDLGFHFYIG